jgi:pimeloyl-ACP methyl ester carboxylesterase
MQIVAKIRSSYQIDFTLREFFEAPTIAELGSVVRAKTGRGAEVQTRDKALSALSPMGQRSFSPTTVQTACFFGHGKQRIFAIHHPPIEATAAKGGGVLTVICAPLFNEYMRTQLALRELAIRLADKGHHVLRFDYRGTGDSSGELEQVQLSDWLDDISLVIHEGRALSGSREVRLVGIRAGALLACRAAAVIDDIERFVLWDPVPDGAEYLRTLRRIQGAIIEMDGPAGSNGTEDALHEYAGYRLSERMVNEFGALDVGTYANAAKSKLYIVGTLPEGGFAVRDVHREVAHFACNWETELENLMMPKPVLERLGACLTTS